MSKFIQFIYFYMWNMIEVGYSPPQQIINGKRNETPFNSWSLEEMEFAQLNSKELKVFFSLL